MRTGTSKKGWQNKYANLLKKTKKDYFNKIDIKNNISQNLLDHK